MLHFRGNHSPWPQFTSSLARLVRGWSRVSITTLSLFWCFSSSSGQKHGGRWHEAVVSQGSPLSCAMRVPPHCPVHWFHWVVLAQRLLCPCKGSFLSCLLRSCVEIWLIHSWTCKEAGSCLGRKTEARRARVTRSSRSSREQWRKRRKWPPWSDRKRWVSWRKRYGRSAYKHVHLNTEEEPVGETAVKSHLSMFCD